VAQVVKPASKHQALSSNPCPSKNKKAKQKHQEKQEMAKIQILELSIKYILKTT
jgi:hypothetical protein